jgi:enamine deaminase RidA (YjgF/YER057c/UK114 family)
VTHEIINPESLGAPKGWNNGVLAPAGGRVLFVAGQVATDADGRIVAGDMAAQWERALENVLAVVRAAGGSALDIGRMTIYVTDRQAYLDARSKLRDVWRRQLGRHFPALALVEVKGLVEDGAVVEIEATAVIPQ